MALRFLELISSGPMSEFEQRVLEKAPMLPKSICKDLLDSLCCWMELCILSDRLQRILFHLGVKDEAALLRELRCIRSLTFRARDHPQWAAFEVWGRLSVWPIQAQLALFLSSEEAFKANRFVQLNMGSGKTRVILPLVLLSYLEQGDRKSVV